MTKLVFVFRTACLCPNSCATRDDRQMRMTDKDTTHERLEHAGYQILGLHDGAANLVAVWRIDRLNLARVAHVRDLSHV